MHQPWVVACLGANGIAEKPCTEPSTSHGGGEPTDDSLLRPFTNRRGRSRAIPRLGDIEQFSTETQTDEFDLLKIAAAEESSARGEGGEEVVDKIVDDVDEEDDPLMTSLKRHLIEATTQFDLDDILCSNYTQTCPGKF